MRLWVGGVTYSLRQKYSTENLLKSIAKLLSNPIEIKRNSM